MASIASIIFLLSTFLYLAHSSETAFLLVQKEASTRRFKDGEEITVSITIFNVGSSTAYDVSLNDDNWSSKIFDVEGNKTVSWDKVEPGGKVSHSFLLKPKEKGSYNSPPAVVNFRVASKTDSQVAYSTPIPDLDVLSDKPLESQFVWVKELAIKFGPLASALSIVFLFIAIILSPTKPRKTKSGKKFR